MLNNDTIICRIIYYIITELSQDADTVEEKQALFNFISYLLDEGGLLSIPGIIANIKRCRSYKQYGYKSFKQLLEYLEDEETIKYLFSKKSY